jgi:surface protein
VQALKNIDVENWNVTNAQNMGVMFRECDALTSLDLSGWKTDSLEVTYYMFESDGALTTIYVGDGWDMSKVTTSENMFNGCTALKGGNNTAVSGNPIDVTYACVDTEETPGYLTHIKDKPAES